MRRPQIAQHGRGGDRIGRSHDRAERDRRRPWDGRDDRSHDRRHDDRGEHDRAEHQSRDRGPVVFEVSQRCVVRGVEEHRRDKQRQRQFGRQRQRRRRDRQKREQGAAKREKYRIGRAEAPCARRKHDGGDKQNQELLEFSHVDVSD